MAEETHRKEAPGHCPCDWKCLDLANDIDKSAVRSKRASLERISSLATVMTIIIRFMVAGCCYRVIYCIHRIFRR